MMRHSVTRMALCLAVLGLLLGRISVAHATPLSIGYTEKGAFLGELTGLNAGELDFEGLAPGVVSGATLDVPGSGVGVTLPSSITDVLGGPGETLDLIVVEDTGDNPTTSGIRSLGADDPGNFNTITALANIDLAFTGPIRAVGLSIISPDEQNVALVERLLGS